MEPNDEEAVRGSVTDALVDQTIGKYHILSVIASGGMGTVYLAEQSHPTREVALKLIRAGMTSKSAMRRFEFEAEILARLRHPGIAQVFDAGTHGAGRERLPFFSMEYIPGAMSITDYADANDLSTRQRLELFAAVCDAVHHGHQKGVIHRDLKPGNVLVDASGHPKVIDFGVARLTDSDIAVTTHQTDLGQLIGTLQYMSPEQCDADPQDLDIRTDVYSLGVVLYELLSGRLPYDVRSDRFRKRSSAALNEAIRTIREETPARLGSRNAGLWGDIETIALKAIEKDRNRRYQSATDLAQDIRRYLQNEPILARPPSLAYQLRMFTKRYRAAFAVATISAAALLLATIVSILFALNAAAQKDRAETEAHRAHQLNEFLQAMLSSADPWEARGPDIRVIDVLDEAARDLETKLTDQPEVKATLHLTLGVTYKNLSQYDKALSHTQEALRLRRTIHETPNRAVAEAMNEVGAVKYFLGDFQAARQLCNDALSIRTDLVKKSNGDPEMRLEVAQSLNYLAACLRALEQVERAVQYQRDCLDIRQELLTSPDFRIASALHNVGVSLIAAQDYEQAEGYIHQALAMLTDLGASEHPGTATCLEHLAECLIERKDYSSAAKLYEDAILIMRTKLTALDNRLANSLLGLGQLLLLRMNDPSGAEPRLREAVDIRLNVFGSNDPSTAWAQSIYAHCLTRLDRLEVAEKLLLESCPILQDTHGVSGDRTQTTFRHLVALYEKLGNQEQMERFTALLVNP